MKRVTKNDLRVVGKVKVKAPEKSTPYIDVFRYEDRYQEILQMAQQCYDGLADLRRRANRNAKYYRGDQWGDIVEVNGKHMTEGDYIALQGKTPLKQNLIRPPLRNILGQYRSSPFKSVVYARNREDQVASEMMTLALESAFNMNDGKERDARQLESFLVKSAVIYNTSYSFDHERMRPIPKFRAINLNRFFCDTNIEDVMGEDIKIIGEIADISKLELISTYAKTPEKQQALEDIYATVRTMYENYKAMDGVRTNHLSFLIPESSNLCRVIKVCVKEGKWRLLVHDYADASYEAYDIKDEALIKAEIASRETLSKETGTVIPKITYQKKFIEEWRYYHLSPSGHCLWESDNPYIHNSHPYVFKFYPMLNGATWSMVEDMIDQQKMVNRWIILQEFIASAAAKGVLLVPEEAIPSDMRIEDFAEEWVRYNGVIKIKTRTKNGAPVPLPQQVMNSTVNPGLVDMINAQIKFLQDVTGVHSAMQGKQASAGTPAALYAQETANASMNILDYLESFASFCKRRDYKVMQLIKQYYSEKHYQLLGNKSINDQAKYFDPDKIRNIDFDNEIAKGSDTPSYRMVVDEMLWEMTRSQMITIEMFLEHSSLPFADKLLATIRNQKEKMMETGDTSGFTPQMLEQLSGQLPQSDPRNLQAAQRMLQGGGAPSNNK